MWSTKGHKNQKLFLENALDNKRFSHAYLFCGPNQVGKRTLALEFAKKILGTDQEFNPDLIVYGQEKYKIENIRQLISELSLKPYQGQYKVAILDNFDEISEEAANSILKTLEEPSPTTIIILIVQNRKRIPSTILSRTQIINFTNVPQEEIKKIKELQSLNEQMLASPIGKLYQCLEDKGLAKQLTEQFDHLKEIKEQSSAKRLIAIKEYAELETPELAFVFENWMDQEHFYTIKTNPAAYKNLQLLIDALSGLKQNFNKKLILEKLFLNLV